MVLPAWYGAKIELKELSFSLYMNGNLKNEACSVVSVKKCSVNLRVFTVDFTVSSTYQSTTVLPVVSWFAIFTSPTTLSSTETVNAINVTTKQTAATSTSTEKETTQGQILTCGFISPMMKMFLQNVTCLKLLSLLSINPPIDTFEKNFTTNFRGLFNACFRGLAREELHSSHFCINQPGGTTKATV